MKLTHPFIYRCHDLDGLFVNVKTLSQFMKRLEKQSQLHPERYSIEKYLGDGLGLDSLTTTLFGIAALVYGVFRLYRGFTSNKKS
jgi:hypothetical protein